MKKYELPRPSMLQSAPKARTQATYVVRASVIDRGEWQGVQQMPEGIAVEDDALPVPDEGLEHEESRVALAPPVPSARRAENVPFSTAVREREPAREDLTVSAGDRATPIAQHIAQTELASQLLNNARSLLGAGRIAEALQTLESFAARDPEHQTCRAMMLVASIALRVPAKVAQHAEWLIARFTHGDVDCAVCDVYSRVVLARVDISWSEQTLNAVIAAAARAQDAAIVIDATNRLLRSYPHSFGLPQALFSAGECQVALGRLDLAQKTFEHIVDEYPMSLLSHRAQEKLRRLRRG